MSMSDRRLISMGGVLMLGWATGCADPCVDDGLSQEPQPGCPVFGADTDGTTTTDDPTTTSADSTGPGPGPSCDNGVQDGDETDVDCGGSCGNTCGGGQGCGSDDDCMSGACGNGGTCEDDPTCSVDGMMNGEETDVDCGGGTCPACDDGEMCQEGSDCSSMVCEDGTCVGPTCSDEVMNGDESDVDCGGSCPGCDNGEMCNEGTDCLSEMCEDGTCTGPTCNDRMMNGMETDVDCGGPMCPGCDTGEDCLEGSDCISQVCNPKNNVCLAPACSDGVMNGDETDVDCGGPCGPTCEPGEGCLIGGDCITQGCDGVANICNDYLSVDGEPSCSNYAGAPVPLTSIAMGGSGTYAYAWTPEDGTLATPDMADTTASPAGFQSYTVTVDDGFTTAQDSVVVVDSSPFDLANNCTLTTANFNVSGSGLDATIAYDMGNTRACETGNNEFGLHLCSGVVFENTRLQGVLEVVDDPDDDDDWMGLVWGAQDASHFYSMTWKRADQNGVFACDTPGGILVRRVEAPTFADLTINDFYCVPNTANSTLLLDPSMTTTAGWVEGESYTVTIDFTTVGSDVTVVRDSDGFTMATFTVADTTFTNGYFGSTAASQQGACVGPLFAECL